MSDFDAVVLGGGPAGAATALSLLRRGHTAAIVEASDYEADRIGETLAPPAGGVLEHLGVWESFLAHGPTESYATRASWGDSTPHDNPFVLTTCGRGWQVERRAFDAMLVAAAAAAGAAVERRARLTRADRTPAGWCLTIRREDGAAGQLGARIVVDATGRHARFARSQGARKLVEDRLVGVSGVFEDVAPAEAGVLVEACRDGWWYSARLPGGRAIVALLSDADIVGAAGLRAPGAWAAALRCRPHTLQRLAGAAWPSRLSLYSARTQRLNTVAGAGWLAAGDAAATVDPLSSQGILKALRGGIFAAYAISDRLDGNREAFARYAGFLAAEHDADRAARAAVYARERRWAAAPFWRRRLALIPAGR